MNSEASFGEIPRSQENRIDFYSCKQFSIDFLYEIMHFNSKKNLLTNEKKSKLSQRNLRFIAYITYVFWSQSSMRFDMCSQIVGSTKRSVTLVAGILICVQHLVLAQH